MDLLFKRYASPFLYMQSLLEMGMLEKGLLKVIEQDNEDRLWQMYLSFKPNESFNNWKEKVLRPNNIEPMTKEEVEEQVNKANDILKKFSEKGGNK